MKQRIKSRQQIAAELIRERSKTDADNWRTINAIDIMLHMLADGQTVRIREDRDMGGTVVEFDD